MDPFRLLAAALLLSSPPGTGDQLPYSDCSGAMRLLAVRLEILDPLETHILTDPKNAFADLNVLRERYQEFTAAPALHECARLPERAHVEDMLAFNRAFQKELRDRLLIDRLHAADLETTLEETERLFRIWDAVREARCEYYYVTARRQALHQLRGMIGMEAFYTGQLPPHIPLWRMPQY